MLRPITPDDFPELSARLPSVLSGDWSVAALAASPYRQRVLVKADVTSVLLGFAEYYQVVDECHLLEIAVWPELQGQGIGKRLLAAVLDEARDSGCTLCLLEVRRSNAPACALYERAGFVLAGTRREYYPPLEAGGAREDALLYSLKLA